MFVGVIFDANKKCNRINGGEVVFWGARNVFGLPKLPIGIPTSKVGWIWCFCIANTFAFVQVLCSEYSYKLSEFSFLNYKNYNLCDKKVTSKRYSFAYCH